MDGEAPAKGTAGPSENTEGMTTDGEGERVAPSKDDVGKSRNALSLVAARRPHEALAVMQGVVTPDAFAKLVKAFALKDVGLDEEAEEAVVAAGMESPGLFMHLMPWRQTERIGLAVHDGLRLQAVISLRLFKRFDLCGWACRTTHSRGIKNPDGSPLLLDIPEADPACICLIDGERHANMIAHISRHGISPKAYREFFGLGRMPRRKDR